MARHRRRRPRERPEDQNDQTVNRTNFLVKIFHIVCHFGLPILQKTFYFFEWLFVIPKTAEKNRENALVHVRTTGERVNKSKLTLRIDDSKNIASNTICNCLSEKQVPVISKLVIGRAIIEHVGNEGAVVDNRKKLLRLLFQSFIDYLQHHDYSTIWVNATVVIYDSENNVISFRSNKGKHRFIVSYVNGSTEILYTVNNKLMFLPRCDEHSKLTEFRMRIDNLWNSYKNRFNFKMDIY